jgi:hypothetical protein
MKMATIQASLRARLSRLAVLAIFGTMVGCGTGSGGQGKVSGRVLLDGSPLPGGTVYFRPADGRANLVYAVLDETGTFSVELPAGEVMVSVDNRNLEPRKPAAPMRLPPKLQAIRDKAPNAAPAQPAEAPPASSGPGKYVKIPEKYYSPDSSGLTFTVQRGDQPHDIPLASK